MIFSKFLRTYFEQHLETAAAESRGFGMVISSCLSENFRNFFNPTNGFMSSISTQTP